MRFNLRDKSLYYLNSTKYQNSLVSDRHPRYFDWVQTDENIPTFYTYTNFEELGSEDDKNAIILESSIIVPDKVEWLYKNHKKFNKIFTHNSFLLDNCANSFWIPGGGIWIGTEFGGGEIKIHQKSKLCSMFSSDKQMVLLHQFRYELARLLRDEADVYTGNNNKFIKPSDYLQPYMFSIIIENYVDKLYFTEKLLNCFATGTIPIYLGATDIGKMFNEEGILRFYSIDEFRKHFDNLTEELYFSKLEAVEENFRLCQQFTCVENYMWEKYIGKV